MHDLIVVGAGPAGLAAGLAAARLGLDVVVVGPLAQMQEGRTAALFQASVALLRNLGAWEALREHVEPLAAIRLIDASPSMFRAPEVTFRAREIDLEAFGYNVPNALLTSALEAAAAGQVRRVEAEATSVSVEADRVVVTAANGETAVARLAGAADGRNSPTRTAAKIGVRSWGYEQTAIVCRFAHSRPHQQISTEFHRRAGPLTVVPGPGDTSHLVWVETPDEARRLAGLGDAAFAAELRREMGGLLGALSNFSTRRAFPISGQTASPLAQNRVALIGEAAHVIPPIGAQGLNLSLRDAATLATIAAKAKTEGRDPGSPATLAAYQRARQSDVRSRVIGVDLLNRSLLSGLLPVHLARGLGLYAMASFPSLRRTAMREGVAPASGLPLIMQADAGAAVSHRDAGTAASGAAPAALDAPAARRA